MDVDGGGVDLFVSKQHLDDADVLLLFEQMSRETMSAIPISE